LLIVAYLHVVIGEMVTLSFGVTPNEVERLVAKTGFSRFVIIDASGEAAGYLHLKDILYADEAERSAPVPLKRVRSLATVRSADEVEDVLEELVGEATDSSQR
jgi:CBS domain containing-hemolysin-like protein